MSASFTIPLRFLEGFLVEEGLCEIDGKGLERVDFSPTVITRPELEIEREIFRSGWSEFFFWMELMKMRLLTSSTHSFDTAHYTKC